MLEDLLLDLFLELNEQYLINRSINNYIGCAEDPIKNNECEENKCRCEDMSSLLCELDDAYAKIEKLTKENKQLRKALQSACYDLDNSGAQLPEGVDRYMCNESCKYRERCDCDNWGTCYYVTHKRQAMKKIKEYYMNKARKDLGE